MPNIHLKSSYTTHIHNEIIVCKSSILKLAWLFVKTEGVNLSYAMKRAWSEAKGELERNFWTNASTEQVDYMIMSCSNNICANPLKIRKWDSVENQHPLDWVAYQLRRQGYTISKVKNDTIIKRNIPLLNINSLKTPKGFNRERNTFKLIENGISYCIKNGFIPN